MFTIISHIYFLTVSVCYIFSSSIESNDIHSKQSWAKNPHLQFLDSPGASSKSQKSIFGCVDIKHRPSSPSRNNKK